MPATRTRAHSRRHVPEPPAAPPPQAVPTHVIDLRPGHAVRLPGYGTLAVTRAAAPVPADLVALRLGWAGLSLIARPDTPVDALTRETALVHLVWWCRHCDGTGQWQPEGRASNGR
ncbi:hypothetical protein ABT158_15665 [Nonomuraea sp. NPDC001636]|uniref:hypothetical protein n=1 Tax=Nonomuraea sp. NPDC001636 TaxID=3154391 RepID=UPI00331BADD9